MVVFCSLLIKLQHHGTFSCSGGFHPSGRLNYIEYSFMVACREALSLVEDLLLHNIVVVCDSKQVVNDIQKGRSGVYGQIIEEIKLGALNFNYIFVLRVTLRLTC